MANKNYKNSYANRPVKPLDADTPQVSDFSETVSEEVKEEVVEPVKEEVKEEVVEPVKEVPVKETIKVIVNTSVGKTLNLRKEPNTIGDPLCVIPRKTKLEVKASDMKKEFAKVTINGVTGYCMTKFLKKA